MTYTNALQVFFERLNYKHSIKGDSFRDMPMEDLDDILMSEYYEWQEAPPNTHHEIEELTDIMVACVIKLEKLLEPKE